MEHIRHPGGRDGRGLSTDLWSQFRTSEMRSNPEYGIFKLWDFEDGDMTENNWTLTQATSGTEVVDSTLQYGVVTIDSGADTDGQGVNLQQLNFGVTPDANSIICMEWRLKCDILSGDHFFGLAESDTTILNTTAITSANHVGFLSLTADGVLITSGEKAGAAATGTTAHTFVADTFVKLGFRIEGLTRVVWSINGTINKALTNDLAAANIPIVILFPSLVCHADGTDPVTSVDWVACGKLVGVL